MNKEELFEKLVELKTDTHTARFSDDASCIKRDQERYEAFLATQDVFTDEEISAESRRRWNLMIEKMNEEYRQRQQNV